MGHPIEKYNEQQAAMLAELPESQRAHMTQLFRIGNTSYRYYQREMNWPFSTDSQTP